jgi:hypothetical protein
MFFSLFSNTTEMQKSLCSVKRPIPRRGDVPWFVMATLERFEIKTYATLRNENPFSANIVQRGFNFETVRRISLLPDQCYAGH